MFMKLGTYSRKLTGLVAIGLLTCLTTTGNGQELRNYNVNFTSNTIVADGVISPGEWDGAEADLGDWRVQGQTFETLDDEGNRFRILWDTDNLYILHQSESDNGFFSNLGGTKPSVVFTEHNLNMYIDPNRDGDFNTTPAGDPIPCNPTDGCATNGGATDGYQIAFNQYEGTTISQAGDFQGVGFFTEAHVNSPFGDQAGWNGEGGSQVLGDAIDRTNIVVGQTNVNGATPSSLSEIVIPFASLDAASELPTTAGDADLDVDTDVDGTDYLLAQQDGTDPIAAVANWAGQYGDGTQGIPTGLNATDDGARTGPEGGEVWGFVMSVIKNDGEDLLLPISNWKEGGSFAPWPHSTITFVAPPATSAVPEPTTCLLAASAGLLLTVARRRR